MTDSDKTVLDDLEREALALLERATFSIRDHDHALAVHTDADTAAAIDPSLGQTPTPGEGFPE